MNELKLAHIDEKQDLEAKARQAEERATAAEERATTAEERATAAEARATAAEERETTAEETIGMWKTKYENLRVKAWDMLHGD